jgi:hypothetical protein
MGGDNGAPCMTDADCKSSFCIPEIDSHGLFGTPGAATGYVQGYCASASAAVDPSLDVQGQPIPPGNCPTGSAPYPADNRQVFAGDWVLCFATCLTNTDCRSGYSCEHLQTGGTMPAPMFSNGLCFPEDCLMSNQNPCPSGYGCQSMATDGGTLGACTAGSFADAGPG